MKDDVAGLVERLRRTHGALSIFGGVSAGSFRTRHINPDGPKAADALTTLSARVETLEAEVSRHRRKAVDGQYMIEALVVMLGPIACKVWEGWKTKGTTRVHYSWGPEAKRLTGEERAAVMLEWDNAPRTEILNVDSQALAGDTNHG